MSARDDTPPPIPSSPPPPPMMEDTGTKRGRRTSDKFKALQKMLSESQGMYTSTSPNSPSSIPAPPPNKKPHLDREQDVDESPKLSHATKSRPKRKVRPPSRSSLGGRTDKSENTQESPIFSLQERTQGNETSDDEAPAPPPPLPSSAPPEVLSGPPPLDLSFSDPTSHQDATRIVSPVPDILNIEDVHSDISGQVSPKTDQISTIAVTKTTSTTSSPSVGSKAIVIGSFSERLKKLQEKRASKSTSPTSLTFPSNLKMNNAQKSPSSELLSSSFSAAPNSTSNTGDSNSSIKPRTISDNQQVNRTSYSSRESSHLSAREHQKTSNLVSTVALKVASNEEPLDENRLVSQEVTNLPVDDGFKYDRESEIESDDDELPPTPPPPIPDLLPSDESESEFGQEEVATSTLRPATITSKVSFRTQQRKDDWKRKIEQLQRDSLKSDALPLLGSSETPQSTSLDVLSDSKPMHTSTPSSQSLDSPLVRKGLFSTSNIVDEQEQDSTSLNDSSESLPSLPDSLPPALPDAPPPTLPEAPPPDLLTTPTQGTSFPSTLSSNEVFESSREEMTQDSLQAEVPYDLSDDSSNESTQGSKCDSNERVFTFNFPSGSPKSSTPSFELSTSIGSMERNGSMTTNDNVQVRHKKPPGNSHSLESSVKRRSAFDALVSVEPTAEARNEPKLSVEDRRQLALMASRGSSADVKTVLNRWSRQAPSLKAEDELRASSTSNILGNEDRPSTNDSGGHTTSMTGVANVEYSSSQGTLQQAQQETLISRKEEPLQYPSEEAGQSKSLEQVHQPLSLNNLQDSRENDSSGLETEPCLPSGTKSVKQIRVISEGTPPSSPDLRFTRIGKEKWKLSKLPPLQFVEDDLSASASTGDILATSVGKKQQPLQKTSSLHSVSSSSESIKTGFVLPWTKSKKSSSKKTRKPPPISPLAAVTVSTQNSIEVPKSPTAISLHSDYSDQTSSPQQTKRKSAGIFESMFASSPKPSSRDNFQYTRSKENLISSLPGRDLKHEEMIEQQLAKVKEQRKMTQELLRRDPLALLRSLTPRGSPRSSRPASMILGTDIYKFDPAQWTTEQVCKWLELVGLGTFKEIFEEKGVTGKSLLQMDVQLFDELGIDSPEIREIFLAKIYELSNPSSSLGEMEDDFLLSVDTYTSDDWKKLQAAVNALKSPVLDDTIELEPSAIGQFIHTDYVRSQSTPNIADIDIDQEQLHPGTLSAGTDGTHFNFISPVHKIRPARTIHSFRNYGTTIDQNTHRRTRQDSDISSGSQQHPSLDYPSYLSHTSEGDISEVSLYTVEGTRMTSEWVAGLPGENVRSRTRALTEPSLPYNHLTIEPTKATTAGPKAKTLPRQSQVTTESSKRKLFKKKSLSPRQLSIEEEPSLLHDFPGGVAVANSRVRKRQRKQSEISSTSRSSATGKGLLKLFMNNVQEGTLYKSFLVGPSATTVDIIAMALDKANMSADHDPRHYCIWDSDVNRTSTNSSDRLLQPLECPMVIQSQWPQANRRYFELSLKDGVQLRPHAPRNSTVPDIKVFELQIKTLLEEKSNLLQQLDEFHAELQDKEELERKLTSLTEECNSMKVELKSQQDAHENALSDMKEDMEELALAKSKLEDQLVVVDVSSNTSTERSKDLLSGIQTKYTEDLTSLKKDLKEKERSMKNMLIKQNTMEEELATSQEVDSELHRVSRLLREHQQQIKTLEQELAGKEDVIHGLRVQLDQTEASANHALTLQETLQAVEIASKQQQDLSNRTVLELKEQVSRLMAEAGRKEQLVLSLKKERDRLTREHQTKDNVRTSLEADLDSYKALGNGQMNESERIFTLQRSLSVHEVALASVRSEYEKQSEDLHAAEEEVAKLRDALAKKEEQLSLLSSSEEHHSRFSLYGLLDKKPPHHLITALVDSQDITGKDKEGGEGSKTVGVERTPSQCLGIKVSGLLGDCVVSEVSEEVATAGIQPGDRLLEINDTSVTGNSQREINTIFRKQCQSQKGAIKLVVARPRNLGSEDMDGLSQLGSADGVLIERYKKLNTSLNNQLDSLSKEVDSWRNECERLKAEMLKYSTANKDKEAEFAFLQSSLRDLKSQLEDSEKARVQLRETLDELEGSVSHRSLILREKERELSQIQTAEKSLNDQLKKLQKENEKAMTTLRSHLVTSEDLTTTEDIPLSEEELAAVSRTDLISRLRQTEEEFYRHKVYLEQLLTVVIDQQPHLLSMIKESQRIKDQMDADSWC